VPASAFNATPNLVLSTAAISYFWIFRSPLAYVRSSSRSNSESPATATEHAALLAAKLCGKPPICALGLFIFVISMRDFFSFHAKGRDSRSSRASPSRCPSNATKRSLRRRRARLPAIRCSLNEPVNVKRNVVKRYYSGSGALETPFDSSPSLDSRLSVSVDRPAKPFAFESCERSRNRRKTT